jgi:DHA1 family tetracycline resistance protein-like MFS transporter
VVAQAYVADVTPAEHRTRNMGLIGMAFGIGFVLGPLLGALLSDLPVAPDWRLRLPFLVAAGFSTLAWILVVWKLPESIPAGSTPRQAARVISRRGIIDTIRLPGVARLMAVAFLTVLAWATMEGTFAIFLQERMKWSASAIGFAFAGSGLVSALVQGGLIRPLVPRFGELKLILIGVVLAGLGFVEVALLSSANVGPLVAAVVFFSVGSGLISPSISGLLSRITPMSEQGAVFGALTSTQTLARIISYLAGNILLARVSPSAPYWFGASIYLAALIAAACSAPNLATVLARSQAPAAEELAVGEGT